MAINTINSMVRPIGQNPDQVAQQYATKNGITLEQAKAELKAKYGDPQKPQDIGGSIFDKQITTGAEDTYVDSANLFEDDTDFLAADNLGFDTNSTFANFIKRLLEQLKGKADKPEQLPESKEERDAYAQEYADENGITLEEAKEILSSMEPKKVA